MNQARNIAMLFVVATALVLMSCAGKQTQTPTTETYYETQYKTEYRTETYTVVEDVVVGTTEGSQILSTKSQWKSTWIGFFDKGEYWTDYYGYDISKQSHTHRQVQISLKINQFNKGAIEVVNLTDACSDNSTSIVGMAFGKLPWNMECGGSIFVPAEGCQLLNPNIVDKKVVRSAVRLLDVPERILGEFSIGEDEGDSITFDANGVKEFAIIVATEPKIGAPDVTLTWADDIIETKSVTKERQVPYQVPVQVEKQRPIEK